MHHIHECAEKRSLCCNGTCAPVDFPDSMQIVYSMNILSWPVGARGEMGASGVLLRESEEVICKSNDDN
jgi:hypothetical protein